MKSRKTWLKHLIAFQVCYFQFRNLSLNSSDIGSRLQTKFVVQLESSVTDFTRYCCANKLNNQLKHFPSYNFNRKFSQTDRTWSQTCLYFEKSKFKVFCFKVTQSIYCTTYHVNTTKKSPSDWQCHSVLVISITWNINYQKFGK